MKKKKVKEFNNFIFQSSLMLLLIIVLLTFSKSVDENKETNKRPITNEKIKSFVKEVTKSKSMQSDLSLIENYWGKGSVEILLPIILIEQ